MVGGGVGLGTEERGVVTVERQRLPREASVSAQAATAPAP